MPDAAPPRRRPARRAGVVRRALRREAARVREPYRVLSVALLVAAFGLVLAGMAARGDLAGDDARAYWAAVRIWLEGGDPYRNHGPYLPYIYAPWMLFLFLPWAVLPWDVAWFAWRGATVLVLLLTIRWAYARRPLPTAVLVALLAVPFAANLDTGNITPLLVCALFAGQLAGPRAAGLAWGLATWMKWVPALTWPALAPRARAWGLAVLGASAVLSAAMFPQTLDQVRTLTRGDVRPPRLDYLVLVWALVPWWWARRDPWAILRPRAWARAAARLGRWAAGWGRAFAAAPGPALRLAVASAARASRAHLGLGGPPPDRPAGRLRDGHRVAEIGD